MRWVEKMRILSRSQARDAANHNGASTIEGGWSGPSFVLETPDSCSIATPCDYAGNHGDLTPGATGEPTDSYYGGNGTGVIISVRLD